jgi:hypothetical protein
MDERRSGTDRRSGEDRRSVRMTRFTTEAYEDVRTPDAALLDYLRAHNRVHAIEAYDEARLDDRHPDRRHDHPALHIMRTPMHLTPLSFYDLCFHTAYWITFTKLWAGRHLTPDRTRQWLHRLTADVGAGPRVPR